MKWLWRPAIGVLALFALGGNCGGGGSSNTPCAGVNTCDQQALTVPQVQQVISQSVAEANEIGVEATIAVLDRVGNVLAVWEMCGNPRPCSGMLPAAPAVPPNVTTITSNRGVTTGLDGMSVEESLAAISKAGSGAYLSSQGNAFTSRTASQIIQENFNPGEPQRGGGPLFGVQFSQLPCGDFMQRFTVDALRGPKRMPLGLAGDPGGIPLYIEGVPVGAVGVEFNGTYTVDPNIFDFDTNLEERIATAGTTDFEPPDGIRAQQIAVDGRTLRYVDDEDIDSNPAVAPAFPPANGQLLSFDGFFNDTVTAGVLFLDSTSGYVRDTIGGQAAEVLVDGGGPRFPPTDSGNPLTGGGGLTKNEVTSILSSALEIASRARGQIRRPGGSSMRVNISIVDLDGDVLGFARSPDAPIFGGDVSLQKARTAVFFSQTNAATNLINAALPDDATRARPLGDYVNDVRDFLGDSTALANGIAFSDRAGGNLSRPFFPDGINGKPNGPLSRPFAQWSPFSTGLQLDASFNNLTDILAGINHDTCTSSPTLDTVKNGFQIFPGSVPIYRGSVLIGAIGVSGDGVDQDDMVALLAVDTAATTSGTGFNNAPLAIRADNISVGGGHLRYVSCPPTPFIGSDVQNVCAGK